MGSIGGGEILIVLLVALIVLGPTRLPQAARQMGRAVGEFRRVTAGFQAELRDTLDAAEGAVAQPPPAAPSPREGADAGDVGDDAAREVAGDDAGAVGDHEQP